MPRDQNSKCSLIFVCLYNHQDKYKLIFLFNLNQQVYNIHCLRMHLIKISNSKTPQQKEKKNHVSINSQFSKGTGILQRKTSMQQIRTREQILQTNCFKMYSHSNSRLPTQPRLVF